YFLIFNNIPFEGAKKEFKKPHASAHELIEWAASNWPESLSIPSENKIVRSGINPLTSSPQLICPKPETMSQEGIKITHKKSFCLYENEIEQTDLIKKCPEIDTPGF